MNSHCLLAHLSVFAALLCGCASNATATPDLFHEGVQRCIASSYDRNACAQYANRRCGGGYEVFEMEAAEDDGVVRRAYYFKCRI